MSLAQAWLGWSVRMNGINLQPPRPPSPRVSSKPNRGPSPPGPSVVSSGSSGGSVGHANLLQTSGFTVHLPGVSEHAFPSPSRGWTTVTTLSTGRNPVPQVTLQGPRLKDVCVLQSFPRKLRKGWAPPVNHKRLGMSISYHSSYLLILERLWSWKRWAAQKFLMRLLCKYFGFWDNLLSQNRNSFTESNTDLSHSIQAHRLHLQCLALKYVFKNVLNVKYFPPSYHLQCLLASDWSSLNQCYPQASLEG